MRLSKICEMTLWDWETNHLFFDDTNQSVFFMNAAAKLDFTHGQFLLFLQL